MTESNKISLEFASTNSTVVKMKTQDFDTIEYFSLKKMLENSYYKNRGFLTQFRKSKCKIFNRPSRSDLSPFERMLISNEDKSAQISLIIKTYELWNNEDFWLKKINLRKVMSHYATDNDANIKNLFSLLMYNWHCPSEESTNHRLCDKFDAYSSTGKSMFTKLFEIIDNPQHKGYELICLRLIYQFLHEKNEQIKENTNFYNYQKAQFQVDIFDAIEDAFHIQNQNYRIQILKILTVVMDNTEDEVYDNLKRKILEIVSYKFEYRSAYRISLDSIEKYCDDKFFNMAFLLKENRLKKFEFEFEEFVNIYQKLYGEYWKVAMKTNARLLYHICEEKCEKKLLKTVEYIFQKCKFIELNSTILTSFEEVAEFYVIFNEPLSRTEEKVMNDINYSFEYELDNKEEDEPFERDESYLIEEIIIKYIKTKKLTRKLLFGRVNVQEMSLIEKILSHPKLFDILGYIWELHHLHEKPEILSLKNFLGNPLLYYAFNAEMNQLIAFISLPSYYNPKDRRRTKFYMILQNSLIYALTGKSLIEYQLDIYLNKPDYELEQDLFPRIIYLLEEIGTIEEIKNDEIFENILGLMRQTKEYSDELFEIDDLVGIMLPYWTPNKGNYFEYKKVLIEINPFFELLFMVIENKQQEFFDNFQHIFDQLEMFYETRYDISVYKMDSDDNRHELYSSNFMFVLFLAAIRTNQHKIIDFIFNNDWFVTLTFGFPENVKSNEIHYYAALNMLENGHELGRPNIPEDWLTKDVLEDFFNSKVSYRDRDVVEVNCESLLHVESQKIRVRRKADVKDKWLMMEDTTSLKYITERENLKSLVTHPVVEIYIELKSYKYKSIFVYNFWAFVLLYILPFFALIYTNHNEILEKENILLRFFANSLWHYIGIVFLIAREVFQGIISGSTKEYFNQRSNYFDIMLIILSIVLSICSTLHAGQRTESSSATMLILEVVQIIFTTICATSLLPLSYVPINMQILKRVSMTFLKIFKTFVIILIAFSFSFTIMFENKFKIQGNGNDTEAEVKGEPEENFKSLDTTILKVIIMLSGEYSIEPIELDSIQLIFFAVFVISSFILFNLILGLSIEDVQELKEGSRQFILLDKAKKLINVGDQLSRYYSYVAEYKENRKNMHSDLDEWMDVVKDKLINLSLLIVKFFLSNYHFLHSIPKIYINIKTREVFVNVNRKYESILSSESIFSNCEFINNKIKSSHKISNTTLHEIQRLINVKNKNEFKNLKLKTEKLATNFYE